MYEATECLSRGQQALEAFRFDDARLAYAQALEHAPQSVDALRGLGYSLFQLRRLAEALDAIDGALRIDSSDLLSRLLMGRLCLRLQQPGLAEDNFRQILQRIPASEAATSGLIDALVAQGGREEAARLCTDLLGANPGSEVALLAAARLAGFECQDKRALFHFDQLVQLRPGNPVHRYNRALCLLRLGRLAEGWRDYEYRFSCGAVHLRCPSTPRWDGRPGRHLLVLAEQGLGDAILFTRFLPFASARCERLSFACPAPLAALIGRSMGVACVSDDPRHWPEHDVHVPLMSLPLVLQIPDATAAGPAYLWSDPARREQWASSLGQRSGLAPRIGLVHATSAAHATEENPFTRRSCAAADLLPLAQGTGFQVYNLNLGRAAEAARRDLPGLRDLPAPIESFEDTAAIISLLDAVVSVDTASAHVAGAIGAPVQLLLPAAPDWKWQPHADASPWYESVQRVRQPAAGGWIATATLAAERLKRTLRDKRA